MAIILNTLKEAFDNVASFIQVGVEFVFHLEVGFIWDTYDCAAFFEIITNRLVRISLVGENFFARKLNPGK